MKNKKTVKKYRSLAVSQLLGEITPAEKFKTRTKMNLAARLDDLISAKGWGKSEFAEKVNKNPSEITKWLSGTHNLTIDTLAEIALVLKMPIAELFAQKQVQEINKTHFFVILKSEQPCPAYATPVTDGYYTIGNRSSVSLISN